MYCIYTHLSNYKAQCLVTASLKTKRLTQNVSQIIYNFIKMPLKYQINPVFSSNYTKVIFNLQAILLF